MKRSLLVGLCGVVGLATGVFPLDSNAAAIQTTYFDSLSGAATVAAPVNAGDTVYVDTLVTDDAGALTQSVMFTVGSGVDSFIGSAAWMISTAAGPGPRLIGVNIDLLDAFTDTLIASDVFGGVLGGPAYSTFAGDIGAGTYKLVATGTGARDALLDISLSFIGMPPAVDSASAGGLPAQGAVVADSPVLSSALTDSRTISGTLGAGDTVYLDALVTGDTGALSQSVTFTLDSGVDGFTGINNWLISTAAGPGPRLIGVNIDLFDSTNALVASDSFSGVLGGFANSAFADTATGPGTYTLVATGTGVRESSLNIALSFTGTVVPDPDPTPEPTPVPEPTTSALLLLGLSMVVLLARRTRGPRSPQ